MKFTIKASLVALLLAIPVSSFAAPSSKNPQRHNQIGRPNATAVAHSHVHKPSTAMDCDGCKAVSVARRGAQKTTHRTQKIECSGCETMSKGGRCT